MMQMLVATTVVWSAVSVLCAAAAWATARNGDAAR